MSWCDGKTWSEKNAVTPSPDWIPHSKPALSEADALAAGSAVRAGYVGSGPLVKAFETQVSARLNRTFARATTTGSSALHLALLAAGTRRGDPVLLPAFVCRAVLNVVLDCGATPVLIDVDPATLCITVDAARAAMERAGISKSANAVLIVVHSFGAVIDVNEFNSLGVKIIEDAASSFGASHQRIPAGAGGLISILSFASTKMMTTGQGGMILTSDQDCAERIDALMDYDCAKKPSHGEQPVAFNYGFTEPQAALGISQLERLDSFVARRRTIASTYFESLAGNAAVTGPLKAEGHGYYRFVVLADSASDIVKRMRGAEIDARTSVSHFLNDYLGGAGTFPGCKAIRNRIVSLPIYPSLSAAEVDRVAAAARDATQRT